MEFPSDHQQRAALALVVSSRWFSFGSTDEVTHCDPSVNRRSPPFYPRGPRRGLGGGFAPGHRGQRLCAAIVVVIVSRQPAGIGGVAAFVVPAPRRAHSLHRLLDGFSPQEFDESYVQTGQGQLYSWSTQAHRRGATPLVLRCNHTVIYEGQEQRQGPVLQLLRVSGISSVYDVFALSLDFHITASLLVAGVKAARRVGVGVSGAVPVNASD